MPITSNTNSIDSAQNGLTKKLIGKGWAREEAGAYSLERSLI
jgi:hypothetical protein